MPNGQGASVTLFLYHTDNQNVFHITYCFIRYFERVLAGLYHKVKQRIHLVACSYLFVILSLMHASQVISYVHKWKIVYNLSR